MNNRFPIGGRAIFGALAAWLLVSGTSVRAASPQLNGFAPFGAQRGTEVQVEFQGERFDDALDFLFYEPGISGSKVVGAPGSVRATFTIAADCRLGQHAFRIRTASGISNLRIFGVGAMKDVAEVEPNSDFAQPQRIELDSTVNGVVTNEDVDYFVFEAKKGERISVEVEGLRLAHNPNGFFDPTVVILDQNRRKLAQSDDTPLTRQDAACGLVVPEDGAYVIQIQESAFNGSASAKYRAHIGHFPRPTGVFPPGGKPGEALDIRWLGDPAGERTETVQLPANFTADFGLYAHNNQGVAPTPNPFRLSEFSNSLEAEPNDEPAQATVFQVPGAANGVISQPGDIDRYKFAAKKGQTFEARVFARSLGSPLDSVMTISRANKAGGLGAALGSNDDTGGPDSMVRFGVPEDGDYFLEIRDQLRTGGADYSYRVEIGPVKPSLKLTLPERVQYFETTAPVPRGNRLAVMLAAQRTDFSGDLQFEFKNLPAGMTAEAIPMPGGRSETLMLFTAAADAPLAANLVDVVGRTTDPQQPIEGHVRQSTRLASQNNNDIHRHYADRMVVALTQESPFTIDIVEPRVPLVRGGTMDLKVVAKRKEGFTGPISAKLLYNPPGVGSSTSVTIPEGKTEAVIAMTANPTADLQTWKIVLLGDVSVGGGQLLASSGFANLQVTEPLVAFTLQPATVEKGQQTDVVAKVEKLRDFAGTARAELVGLPNGVTAEPVDITKDSTEVVFKTTAAPTANAGRFKTLLARVTIMENAEPIVHLLGPGDLRVDNPLPAKSASAQSADGNPQAAAQASNRLNRLEKLRQEREQPAAGAPQK